MLLDCRKLTSNVKLNNVLMFFHVFCACIATVLRPECWFIYYFTSVEINRTTAVSVLWMTWCTVCWNMIQPPKMALTTNMVSFFSFRVRKRSYHNYFACILFVYPYSVTKSEQFSSAALSSTGTYHSGACTGNKYHTCTLSLASAVRRVILGRKKKNHYMRRMKCRTQRRVCSCVHTRRKH